jgi:hypothetical protein
MRIESLGLVMTKYDDRRSNAFLVLWTLSVMAATAAFLFYLAVRVESLEYGYELGKAYSEVSRLREMERVMELEEASHNTPERVDLIARSLFFMEEPQKDRVVDAGKDPRVGSEAGDEEAVAQGSPP